MTQPPTPHPQLHALGLLVGRWDWRGRSAGGDFDVTGWAAYEWLEGGFFLVERSALTAAGAVNHSLAVTGYDAEAGGCIARYFDSDGRQDRFRIGVEGDRLKIAWPNYRFAGLIAPDRNRIEGPWEMSSDGRAWTYWYDAVMTRLA